MMKTDDTLKAFIPLPAITKLVRDFHLAAGDASEQVLQFLGLPEDEKLKAAYEIAGPGPHQARKVQDLMSRSLEDFQRAQAEYQAKLSEEMVGVGLAEIFRDRLDRLGTYTKDPAGAVLVNAKGVNPELARFMVEGLPVPEPVVQQLIPLMADEFRRLAAVPDLTLPHARLHADATQTEIRLFGTLPHIPSLYRAGGAKKAGPR